MTNDANEAKAPREWWIEPEPWDYGTTNSFDAFDKHPGQGPLQWQASLIHVIEHSAYTDMQSKLASALAMIEKLEKLLNNVNKVMNTPTFTIFEAQKQLSEWRRSQSGEKNGG